LVISTSVTLFIFARFVLAVGESANFPASIKATAEYFPKKDRAFSTSIFLMLEQPLELWQRRLRFRLLQNQWVGKWPSLLSVV